MSHDTLSLCGRSAAAALLALGLFATARGADLGDGMEVRVPAIVPWMQDDARFLTSPDGSELLLKDELSLNHVELRLFDLDTRRPQGVCPAEWPLLICWRPKSNWLAFVEDSGGDYHFRLKFWDRNRLFEPATPQLHTADHFLRWSPDGRYLAVPTPTAGREDEVRVVDAREPLAGSATAYAAEGIYDMGWSPDATRLAVLATKNDGDVAVVDWPGRRVRRYPVAPGAFLRQLAWQPDGRGLLVTVRPKDHAWFSLHRLDLASGQVQLLAAPEGDVTLTSQSALADGRYLYGIVHLGQSRLMLGRAGAEARVLGFSGGTNSLLGIDARRGDVLVEHKGLTEPRSLYRVPFSGGPVKREFRREVGGGAAFIAPERVEIPVSGGIRLPFYVWHTPVRPSRGVVLAFPVIRRIPLDVTFDGSMQYLLQQGYDYVMLDFRPLLVHPDNWDTYLADENVQDAVAIATYAHQVLGAPWNRILYYGQSYGAFYAMKTLARLPVKQGMVLFRGITPNFRDAAPVTGHHFRVGLFQSGNDPTPPALALSLVEAHLGADSLRGARGFFRVIPNEGHHPRFFIISKAQVTAGMAQMLAAPPWP